MIDVPSIVPLLQGIVLGTGICLSLGPQTVLVLRQGMRGEAAFAVAAICTAADFLLIAMAAAGAHGVVRLIPDATAAGAWGAALCCAAYGCFALHAARRQRCGGAGVRPASAVRAQAILAAFALSLLNPQTYLEMVLLVGSVALIFPPGERALFALGVALVSPVWFFGLAVGGRRFAGLFSGPGAARMLDVATGVVMLVMAAALIKSQVPL